MKKKEKGAEDIDSVSGEDDAPGVRTHISGDGQAALPLLICERCGDPMIIADAGQTTHPNCDHRVRITSDLDLRWRTRQVVASDLDVRWQTLTLISSDHDLRRRVLQCQHTHQLKGKIMDLKTLKLVAMLPTCQPG